MSNQVWHHRLDLLRTIRGTYCLVNRPKMLAGKKKQVQEGMRPLQNTSRLSRKGLVRLRWQVHVGLSQ